MTSPAAPDIWLQTMRSGHVDLMDPQPTQISFRTMGESLARVPRWSAQTEPVVFSVAQHLEQGARAIQRELGRDDIAAAYLLHDGHEYVIGDQATPVTRAIAGHAARVMGNSEAIEAVKRGTAALKVALDTAIYGAAGIPYPLTPEVHTLVKIYDERMLATEHRECMAASPFDTWRSGRPQFAPLDGVDCTAWPEALAASLFGAACRELLPVFGARVA